MGIQVDHGLQNMALLLLVESFAISLLEKSRLDLIQDKVIIG